MDDHFSLESPAVDQLQVLLTPPVIISKVKVTLSYSLTCNFLFIPLPNNHVWDGHKVFSTANYDAHSVCDEEIIASSLHYTSARDVLQCKLKTTNNSYMEVTGLSTLSCVNNSYKF